MTDPKPIRTVDRGRIFADISVVRIKSQWKAQQEEFSQRGKVIFDQVKPELINI
ncbi:hypothetical protein [Nostoc sp. CALU 546]|uniref:hypothetical protein n=1 Tax=Nostoc sp. CALU 546 TaxID=1867241 RepID=UPI003B67741D